MNDSLPVSLLISLFGGLEVIKQTPLNTTKYSKDGIVEYESIYNTKNMTYDKLSITHAKRLTMGVAPNEKTMHTKMMTPLGLELDECFIVKDNNTKKLVVITKNGNDMSHYCVMDDLQVEACVVPYEFDQVITIQNCYCLFRNKHVALLLLDNPYKEEPLLWLIINNDSSEVTYAQKPTNEIRPGYKKIKINPQMYILNFVRIFEGMMIGAKQANDQETVRYVTNEINMINKYSKKYMDYYEDIVQHNAYFYKLIKNLEEFREKGMVQVHIVYAYKKPCYNDSSSLMPIYPTSLAPVPKPNASPDCMDCDLKFIEPNTNMNPLFAALGGNRQAVEQNIFKLLQF